MAAVIFWTAGRYESFPCFEYRKVYCRWIDAVSFDNLSAPQSLSRRLARRRLRICR